MNFWSKVRCVPLCLLVAGGLLGSCAEEGEDLGGLMLAISSDGPLPLNRLEIKVTSGGKTLRSASYRVPEEAPLPTTLAIVTNGDPTASVEITVVGWNDTLPLDRRDAIVTQVPTDRVAMLPVVLSGRCSSKVMAVDGEAVSTCEQGTTCDPETGNCSSATVNAATLMTYDLGDEEMIGSFMGSGGSTSGSSGSGGGGTGGSAGSVSEGGTPGSGGAGGEDGGAGGQPDASGGSAGSGGMSGSGGNGGASGSGGNGGTAGTSGNGGGGGNGGTAGSGGTAGTSGSGGNGGSGGMCTTEICDGLDNDCDETEDQPGTCPTGCIGATNPPHRYIFCPLARTRTDAHNVCISHGLQLVTIESQEENDYLTIGPVTPPFWIGAMDTSEGVWRWPPMNLGPQFWQGTALGDPVGGLYNNWVITEPNNSPTTNADCAIMRPADYEWEDVPCNSGVYEFICRDL